MNRSIAFGVVAALALLPALAFGDDWTADKLRGSVLQLVDGQWQPLGRGMIVPDTRVIRTTAAGHVTFTRGGETVELGPNTQIQIYDKGGKKPFTTVKQYFGTVSVEAEVLNVQHFAVDTPFLAAVVKGTRFVVTSGKSGTGVAVRRGHVAVEDKHDKSHVTIGVGQSATINGNGPLEVMGSGKLPKVLGMVDQAVDESTGSDGSKGKSKANEDKSNNEKSGLVSVTVGDPGNGSGLVTVSVGGNGNSGKGNSGNGDGDSGKGKIVNVSVGGVHIGL